MWQGRGSRWWGRRRAVALGAALLMGWAVLARAPSTAHHSRHFPTVRPDLLAFHLADFSNHAFLYPDLESWTIEAEWRNVTSWRYEVSYSCGARCAGRAAVTALTLHEDDTPRHGPAHRHRVLLAGARCSPALPPLPWPLLCEEAETETLIEGENDGRGAWLTENMRARCSPLAALLARCASAADLRAQSDMRLRALSAALVPTL